jgi:hypothetical protein
MKKQKNPTLIYLGHILSTWKEHYVHPRTPFVIRRAYVYSVSRLTSRRYEVCFYQLKGSKQFLNPSIIVEIGLINRENKPFKHLLDQLLNNRRHKVKKEIDERMSNILLRGEILVSNSGTSSFPNSYRP